MSAQDWLLILGAIGGLATIIGAQVVLIVNAINRRADQAEASRQAIAMPQRVADATAATITPPPAPPQP